MKGRLTYIIINENRLRKFMKKYIVGSVISLAMVALIGGSIAFAQGANADSDSPPSFMGKAFGKDRMIEDKAEILGMTTEELQNELEAKTMSEIFDENGITHQQLYEQRQDQKLEQQASMLDITADELKSELEDKTFAQLLDEKGISHVQLGEMRHNQMRERMTEQLQQMVDEGTITQEQMQLRLEQMEERGTGDCGGFGRGGHHGMLEGM